MEEGRKNQIEERHYDVWINPEMKDSYQKDFVGTRKGLTLSAMALEDSASAKLVCDGIMTGQEEWKNSPVQIFYISPGVTVTALYNKNKGEKLRKVICTGHPEDHEPSKLVLERLVGIESGIERIKLTHTHTQPI